MSTTNFRIGERKNRIHQTDRNLSTEGERNNQSLILGSQGKRMFQEHEISQCS